LRQFVKEVLEEGPIEKVKDSFFRPFFNGREYNFKDPKSRLGQKAKMDLIFVNLCQCFCLQRCPSNKPLKDGNCLIPP